MKKESEMDMEMREGGAHEQDVDPIIDLTLEESGSEDDAMETMEDRGHPRFGEQVLHQAEIDARNAAAQPQLVGPGRIAPIPTFLKIDQSGIGHRRQQVVRTTASPYAKKKSDNPRMEQRKRVTHTESEIRALERGKVVRRLDGEALEMRKRGQAKRDAKRDREETKQWREFIYA